MPINKFSEENKTIAIQLFEIVDNKISFSDYFAPKKIWEDTLQWMEWSNTFKGNHSICLYFYEPDPRQINLFDSSLDTDSRVTPTFNNETTEHESFLITDYNIHEHEINSTFQLHINTDVIYECLQKSSHQVCKNLLKEFSYHLLNQQLKAHVDKKTVLTKI